MKIVREKLTVLSMLTALTVVLAMFFTIPVPMTKGYVNFLEVGIYTAAMLYGGVAGLLVGAISGGMLDMLLGYPQWIIFSVLIHGAQGYIAGKWTVGKSYKVRLFWLGLASLIMVVGYFFAGALLYGYGASLASIPGNIIQVIFGTFASLMVVGILEKRSLVKP